MRRWLAGAAVAAATAAPGGARADDARGVEWLITETSILNYHIDNRDSDRLNDNYGEWLNRLNVQATRGTLTAQLRLDSALYFLKPNPNRLAEADAADNASAIARNAQLQNKSLEDARADFIEQQTTAYGRNLSTRYLNTFYPSKVAVSYTDQGLDLTVGDFYTQLGRGMVLALRKADELAVDTTLRGAKVDYKPDLGSRVRLGVTLLAGYTNPLRVDEVSGRRLGQASGGFEGAIFPLAPGPNETAYIREPRPTFAPDQILGARFEQGVREVQVSFQGAMLRRTRADFYNGSDLSPQRNVHDMINASVGINVPSIADHGSLYVEAALQSLHRPYTDPRASPDSVANSRALIGRLTGGNAFYALATAYQGPVTLTVEGKHYDRFYPMLASVSREATEFLSLQYSAVPTTEFIWSDTQFNWFNTCVTGGRARLDARLRPGVLVYASVGRYVTFSERVITCGQETTVDDEGNAVRPKGRNDKIRNDVWDPWVGFEWNAEDNRSHAYGSVGTRIDNTPDAETYAGIDEPTNTFYREYYHFRYDLVRRIGGPFSLQTAGFHRYRFKVEQKSTPWFEGENYLSLIYSPKLTAAFGYEYTTVFGEHRNFFNGQLLYRYTTDKTVRLFVGQSRPALRCVSGVCRQFPAFEGAKLEVVMRF